MSRPHFECLGCVVTVRKIIPNQIISDGGAAEQPSALPGSAKYVLTKVYLLWVKLYLPDKAVLVVCVFLQQQEQFLPFFTLLSLSICYCESLDCAMNIDGS